MRIVSILLSVSQVLSEAPVLPSSLGGGQKLRTRLQNRAKSWYREAKALTSSDFESALLKATRPDDYAPKEKHVNSIVVSVDAFDAFLSADCDPYALLLHKVWSRLIEPSPYTVAKAIYIYRKVLLPHSHLIRARRHLGKQHSVKSGTRYFDQTPVLGFDPSLCLDAPHWHSFLRHYWAYVDQGAWLTALLSTKILTHTQLANTTAQLLSLAAKVLFSKTTGKRRSIPNCPLARACALQILEDIYALHFTLALCLSTEPQAILNTSSQVSLDFFTHLRATVNALHPPPREWIPRQAPPLQPPGLPSSSSSKKKLPSSPAAAASR